MKGKGKGKGTAKAKAKAKSKNMQKSEKGETTINAEVPARKMIPTTKTGQPEPTRQQSEISLEHVCDKCGAIFATEYELDHHDKTDH